MTARGPHRYRTYRFFSLWEFWRPGSPAAELFSIFEIFRMAPGGPGAYLPRQMSRSFEPYLHVALFLAAVATIIALIVL
jgi:hypothetical protein